MILPTITSPECQRMLSNIHLGFVGRVLGPPTMTTWWSLSMGGQHWWVFVPLWQPASAFLYACVYCVLRRINMMMMMIVKFGWNGCSIFDNTKISILCQFGLNRKRLFKPQNCGREFFFGGGISPTKRETISTKPPRCTPLRESASFESSSVKIRRGVWPATEFPKKDDR